MKNKLNKRTTREITNLSQPDKKKVSEKKLQALAKARAVKKEYNDLREAGFVKENIYEAQEAIKKMLDRLNTYAAENNPAVQRLMDEIGGEFKSKEEIESLRPGEYIKYATSLRTFLHDPVSSEEGAKYLTNQLADELAGDPFRRRKGESINSFLKRRNDFIKANEDIAKEAFELYRRLEETYAGQIIKSKFAPTAYGSDNLIIDIFDFMESEYDGDFEKAKAYWTDLIEEQSRIATEVMASKAGVSLGRFRWSKAKSYLTYKL